jgi:hypothetical protein
MLALALVILGGAVPGPGGDAGIPAPQFAAFVSVPGEDPFPGAPGGEGWGLFSGPDNVTIHLVLLNLAEGETAAAALSRRNVPAPRLPETLRLLFEVKTAPANRRELTSTVVERAPIFTAADIVRCEVVRTPLVTFDLTAGSTHSASRPGLRLQLTEVARSRLAQLAKKYAESQRLELAFGDEAVAFLYLAHVNRSPLETDLEEVGVAQFRELCASRVSPAR